MRLFTTKELVELLGIKQPNISKALKNITPIVKKIDGIPKPVNHYSFDDLPLRFQEVLKQKLEPKELDEAKIESKIPDLANFFSAPLSKQIEAKLKAKLIEAYLLKDSKTTINQFIENLSDDFDTLSVNEFKIYRWLKSYQIAKAKGISVLETLIDTRGKVKEGQTKLTEDMQNIAIRQFTKRLRINAIYNNLLFKFGDALPSKDTLRRFLENWKQENYMFFNFAQNPDKFKSYYMSAQGNMSERVKYRNHYWELDSTPVDLLTSDGKRWALLGAIDVYSRRVVFHLDERSSSYAIARLLRKAILKFGVPENVVTDNGRDYTSNHFDSICINLGIHQEIVPPYSGEMKPHIERVFGTLSRELFEELEGYIGHSVAERSEIQSRKGFKGKIKAIDKFYSKEDFTQKWKIKPENVGIELDVLLSSQELARWIDDWNNKIYDQRVHGSLKISPLQKWQNNSLPVQAIEDEKMLDILLGESFVRRVSKKGINLHGALYNGVELAYYVGADVRIMTTDNLGYIRVYEMNYKFISIAIDYALLGKSREELKTAKKISFNLMKQFEKNLSEMERLGIMDPTIKDRITIALRDELSEITNPTYALPKQSEVIDALKESQKELVAKQEQELIDDSQMPKFTSFKDRFLWKLEKGKWSEADELLKNRYPDSYEIALKEFKSKKCG